ncbi:aminotransferase class V-fold PLP-dependent enzyme [Staphylococcus canis]|uniref:Aminotransferase class V-fold PLP-dependent enzyme n=1 Tax=Staphylococcus canis TaxID=2724942 RepID=A0ABS0TAJ1_9STAP|nr:aminotransferase class V-fold PLP-dependent enzyme [Staphylococcus canis]
MQRPLWHKLKQWSEHEPISMHVPGHKNGTIGDMGFVHPQYDITEITGFDDLHHPEAVLHESMEQIRKHPDYDAYYLVNGTTSGILAVIHAFQSINGEICMNRHVHKSVFNALDLGQQTAQIMQTKVSSLTGQYVQPVWSSQLSQNGKLGVITYPNYYGETFNIQQLIEEFHSEGIPVLIDEAHAAHFDLKGFPVSSLNYGADYVVQSYHKTLPSLTMSSILFIHHNAPHRARIESLLQTFQSSSPSYLLMTSLEQAQSFYNTYDSDVFFQKRQHLIRHLKQNGYTVIEMDDPLKLVIRYEGLSGKRLKTHMENYAIDVELSDTQSVLWILPLWYQHDYYPFNDLIERMTMLAKELSTLSYDYHTVPKSLLFTETGRYNPEVILNIQSIPYQNALGHRLAEHLIPYPPGIPTLYKGEVITKDMIKLIEYWSTQQIRVEGLSNGKIKVKDDL